MENLQQKSDSDDSDDSSDEEDRLRRLFVSCDRDGDGFIDRFGKIWLVYYLFML